MVDEVHRVVRWPRRRAEMKERVYYDPEWADSRRAAGGQSRLQGRLNEGFRLMMYGDQDPEDMNYEERRERHLPYEERR